jgi:hypothetical protein
VRTFESALRAQGQGFGNVQAKLHPICIHQFTEAAESLNIALKGKFLKEDDVVRTQLYRKSAYELT